MPADKISIERIKTLHPKIRQEVLQIYNHINENLLGKGVRLRFAYTYRTPEEQHKLFLQRPRVTRADSYLSVHQYGLALDFVLLYDLNEDGTFETASWDMKKDFDKDKEADWMEVVNYFKVKGWEAGIDWKSFPDAPHLQKTFGLTVKQMKSKLDAGHFTTEDINGQKIKYINL